MAAIVVLGAVLTFISVIASLAAGDISLVLFQTREEHRVATTRIFILSVGLYGVVFCGAGLTLNYLRFGQLNVFRAMPIEPAPQPESSYRSENVPTEGAEEATGREQSPQAAAHQLEEELQIRLDQEIDAQNRKANLNLTFGSAAGVIAFLVLAISLFFPPVATNETSFWATFGARAMMSITASLYAFFFLSTYRRNLGEIRYFHNEMTNAESKILAMRLAQSVAFEDESRRDAVLEGLLTGLAATERNFILKRGETTTDLSQRELDIQEQATLTAALASIKGLVSRGPEAEAPASRWKPRSSLKKRRTA